MVYKQILTAVAVAALIPAAAFAQRGPGGGHGGPPSGMGGPGNAGGFGIGGPAGMGIGGMNDTMRDMGRLNSQGPANASQTGTDHANQNSVLAGTTSARTATSGPLAGLTTGTTLYSNGTAVGTVQQIRITGRGSVAMVIVKGTNGGLYAVPANKLNYSEGMLSTSVRLAGVNTSTTSAVSMNSRGRVNSQGPMHASATGIAHANAHSVLASGSTTALTGVSVGMPLYSNGTQVGSVYRVVTANGVITRVLVQGTNGRIYSLSPSTLTAAGGSVTTTATLRGI